MPNVYRLDEELIVPFIDRIAGEAHFLVHKNNSESAPVFFAKKSLKGGYEKHCEHEHELGDALRYLQRSFNKKSGRNSGVLKWLCPKCQKTGKIRAFDPHVIFSFFPETFSVKDYPQVGAAEDDQKLRKLRNMTREDFIHQIESMILERIGTTSGIIEDDFNAIKRAAETDIRLKNVLDSIPKELQICVATSYVFRKIELSFTSIIAMWLFILYKSLMYEGLAELRNDLKLQHPDETQTLKHAEALLNFEEKLLYEVCEIRNKTFQTGAWNIFEYLLTENGNCMGFSQTVYLLLRQLLPINRIRFFSWEGHVNLGLILPNPSDELIDKYVSNELGELLLYEPTEEREKAKKELSVLVYETTIKNRVKLITLETFLKKKPYTFFIAMSQPTDVVLDYFFNAIPDYWYHPYELVKIFQICEPLKWEPKLLANVAELSMKFRLSAAAPYLIVRDEWVKERWLGELGSLLGNLPEFLLSGKRNRRYILRPLLFCFVTFVLDNIQDKNRMDLKLSQDLETIRYSINKIFDDLAEMCEDTIVNMVLTREIGRSADLIRSHVLKDEYINFYTILLQKHAKFERTKVYLIKTSQMMLAISADPEMEFNQKINAIANSLTNREFLQ